MATSKQSPVEIEVKEAERDKYLAESEKAKTEKLKLNFEYEQAVKESSKKWWRKKDFRQQLLTAILAMSLLGFYVTYVIEPGWKIDNLNSKINNLTVSLKNTVDSTKLYKDSVEFSQKNALLKTQQQSLTSLQALLSDQQNKNYQLNDSITRISHLVQSTLSSIKKYTSDVPRQTHSNIVQQAISNLQTIDVGLNQFKQQTISLDSISVQIKKQNLVLDTIARKSQKLDYQSAPVGKFNITIFKGGKQLPFYEKYAIRLNEVNKHGDFINIDLLGQKDDDFEEIQNIDINRGETKIINLPDGSLSFNISANDFRKTPHASADFTIQILKKK